MFLCVSGTKGLKTDEKRAKFDKLAETVLELSEIVRNGPWMIYFEEKSTTVPQESRNDISDSWSANFNNWQKWPLKFQFWQKWSMGIQIWKITFKVIWYMEYGKFYPWKGFGKLAIQDP